MFFVFVSLLVVNRRLVVCTWSLLGITMASLALGSVRHAATAPKGVLCLVLRACFPSTASQVMYLKNRTTRDKWRMVVPKTKHLWNKATQILELHRPNEKWLLVDMAMLLALQAMLLVKPSCSSAVRTGVLTFPETIEVTLPIELKAPSVRRSLDLLNIPLTQKRLCEWMKWPLMRHMELLIHDPAFLHVALNCIQLSSLTTTMKPAKPTNQARSPQVVARKRQ